LVCAAEAWLLDQIFFVDVGVGVVVVVVVVVVVRGRDGTTGIPWFRPQRRGWCGLAGALVQRVFRSTTP